MARGRVGKTVGYARVSSAGQSVRGQVDELVAAGVPPESVVVEYGSGASARPRLDRLMSELEAGDTFVIVRLDRLGRSMVDLSERAAALEEKKVNLRVLAQDIDTRGPVGKLVWHLLAACAEFERAMIRERTIAGQARAKARGVHVGRKPILTPIEKDQARAWRLGGNTMVSIAARLHVSESTVRRFFREERAAMKLKAEKKKGAGGAA